MESKREIDQLMDFAGTAIQEIKSTPETGGATISRKSIPSNNTKTLTSIFEPAAGGKAREPGSAVSPSNREGNHQVLSGELGGPKGDNKPRPGPMGYVGYANDPPFIRSGDKGQGGESPLHNPSDRGDQSSSNTDVENGLHPEEESERASGEGPNKSDGAKGDGDSTQSDNGTRRSGVINPESDQVNSKIPSTLDLIGPPKGKFYDLPSLGKKSTKDQSKEDSSDDNSSDSAEGEEEEEEHQCWSADENDEGYDAEIPAKNRVKISCSEEYANPSHNKGKLKAPKKEVTPDNKEPPPNNPPKTQAEPAEPKEGSIRDDSDGEFDDQLEQDVEEIKGMCQGNKKVLDKILEMMKAMEAKDAEFKKVVTNSFARLESKVTKIEQTLSGLLLVTEPGGKNAGDLAAPTSRVFRKPEHNEHTLLKNFSLSPDTRTYDIQFDNGIKEQNFSVNNPGYKIPVPEKTTSEGYVETGSSASRQTTIELIKRASFNSDEKARLIRFVETTKNIPKLERVRMMAISKQGEEQQPHEH